MKNVISLLLAVAIGVAGFAESRQADKTLDGYFKQRLTDVEMCLEVKDGEQCLRCYHEMWGKGYRLTDADKENVEQAFTICKNDYKMKLVRVVGDPRFKEEDVRKRWIEIMDLYNDLTSKQRSNVGSEAKKQPEPVNQPSDRTLGDYFKQKLMDVEMCLDAGDGELCLRFYHEMWGKGYRLTDADKENVEEAFKICKNGYKMKLLRTVRDPRFKEEDVRKWWETVLALYNDLTRTR